MLSPEQVQDWVTFYGIEPWGYVSENQRFGMLAATIANFAGKVARKVFKPSDFTPRPAEKPKTVAQRIRAAFGVPENHGKAG